MIVIYLTLLFAKSCNYRLLIATSLPISQSITVCRYHFLLGRSDSAVVRAFGSHQCGPSSIPEAGAKCEFEFVFGSLPSSQVLRFSLSTKTNTFKFQPRFSREQLMKSHSAEMPLKIPIPYHFIYLHLILRKCF